MDGEQRTGNSKVYNCLLIILSQKIDAMAAIIENKSLRQNILWFIFPSTGFNVKTCEINRPVKR